MGDQTGAASLAATVSAAQQDAYRAGHELRRRFPIIPYLRRKARTRIPYFAFETAMAAPAATPSCHNWAALDAVKLVPRCGVMPALLPIPRVSKFR